MKGDIRRIRRGEKSGWVFVVVGIILLGFGYTFYDAGLRYSGIMLMVMGIASIAFGFILVRYSIQIRRKYLE